MSATFDFAGDAATDEPRRGKATLADAALGSGRSGAAGDYMARMVEQFDWQSTPLGPIEHWPAELTTLVRHVLESRFPKAIAWGPELTTIYNDAFRPILGMKPEALGRPFSEVWAEVWADIGPIAERALGGEATFIEDHPLIIDRSGEPEKAWFTFCYSPVRLADGSIHGMLDTVIETTGTVRAREDLVLINKELGHRLKNTLALVQSIALQTLQGNVERDAITALQERIAALGRAHDVLLQQDWDAVSLGHAVRQTLEPLDGLGQITAEGPDLAIGSASTMTLSLILHELATNASKYGALSVPSGKVVLSWSVEDENLNLRWQESGGPLVEAPSRLGFGSRLIDRGLGSSCKVERSYDSSGFRAEIEIPVTELKR